MRIAPTGERPVRADGDTLGEQPLADEELERRPRSRLDVDEPVDLPLRLQLRPAPPRLLPVGHLRQAAELPREHGTVLDRALELLVADRDVESRLPERLGQ